MANYGPCNNCAGRGWIPFPGKENQVHTLYNGNDCQICGGTGRRFHVREENENYSSSNTHSGGFLGCLLIIGLLIWAAISGYHVTPTPNDIITKQENSYLNPLPKLPNYPMIHTPAQQEKIDAEARKGVPPPGTPASAP